MRLARMAGGGGRGFSRWPAELVALGLLAAPLALCGSEPAARTGGPTEQNALAADQEIARALKDNDAAALARVLDTDWVVVNSHGGISARDPVVEAVKAGEFMHRTYTMSEPRVRLYGNVATVTSAVKTSGALGGKDFEVALRQTDVLVWRDGRWHAVLMHESDLRQ